MRDVFREAHRLTVDRKTEGEGIPHPTRPQYQLTLLTIIVFACTTVGYITFRWTMHPGIFGGDVVNVSLWPLVGGPSSMHPMGARFIESGFFGGLAEINYKSYFTLNEPTRYAVLTSLFTAAMQSYVMAWPDRVFDVVIVNGVLFGAVAVVTFLVGSEILKSLRWSLLAVFLTMTATSTTAASMTLFSLPYLFVPLAMMSAIFAYLRYRRTAHAGWLIVLTAFTIAGPWFREFASAIPFIILLNEILVGRGNRAKPIIALCLPLAIHCMFPSLLPWLIGLNNGIITSVASQSNAQAQFRPYMNYFIVGMIFVQFAPTTWALAALGGAKTLRDVDLKIVTSRFGGKIEALLRTLLTQPGRIILYTISIVAFVFFFYVLGHEQYWIGHRLQSFWALGLTPLTLIFPSVILLLIASRDWTLPIFISVLTSAFLVLALAEVHLSFLMPALSIVMVFAVRRAFEIENAKLRLAISALLVVGVADQALNTVNAARVQNALSKTNDKIGQWMAENTPSGSTVIANFYNYADIFRSSGYHFKPYESVANNPLGAKQTIDTVDKMTAYLRQVGDEAPVYFIAADLDYLDWQRDYHSHKWVRTPPGMIERVAYFPVNVHYHYVDPIKYLTPRYFVSFPGYMDWSTDFYFNNTPTPFVREVSVDYTIFRLTSGLGAPTGTALGKAMAAFLALGERENRPVPSLIEEGIGPRGDMNLVRLGDVFYLIPQRLGAIDWLSPHLDETPGLFKGSSKADVLSKVN